MSTKVGLGIDHRKAITDREEKIEEIGSRVEKQLQRAGDSPGERLLQRQTLRYRQRPLEGDYEVVQVPADDSRKREAVPTTGFANANAVKEILPKIILYLSKFLRRMFADRMG